ncbi:hypothetical protein B296_00001090 [Ensete ventricosum]|uniref:Uncharacterized protein n=1 Tax=Ensete ventricosum TaxID=4639 RepID=A0A426Y4A6_ENSVE|nr:hypothetical protein B296_00001090 [Ensete ventricosum]
MVADREGQRLLRQQPSKEQGGATVVARGGGGRKGATVATTMVVVATVGYSCEQNTVAGNIGGTARSSRRQMGAEVD